MKPKNLDLPSIYEAKQFKKAGLHINYIYLFAMVLLTAILFRGLNLGLHWFLYKKELQLNCATKSVQYTFVNFSNQEDAVKKIRPISKNTVPKQPLIAVAYFNFLHPLVMEVQNNNTETSVVDIGPLLLTLEPGSYYISISLADFVTLHNKKNNTTVSRHFGTSLLAKLFPPPKTEKKNSGISYIVKDIEKSVYLKIPYLIYFFLPLLVITILGWAYSRAIWVAFFYFPLLALLFDFRLLFFRIPLHFIIHSIQGKLFTPLELVTASILLLIFLAAGVTGIFNWKQRRNLFAETFIVAFFLILPIILRF